MEESSFFKEGGTKASVLKVEVGQPQQCHVWSMYPLLSCWYEDNSFSYVVQLKTANKLLFSHYSIEAKDFLQAACFGKLLALGLEENN